MAKIELSGSKGRGMFLIVDDEDLPLIEQHKWYYSSGYAVTVKHVSGNKRNRNQEYLSAHRYVLGLTKGDGEIVDHVNRNRLDCRKNNLRITDYSGNAHNSAGKTTSSSGYKGVQRESFNCYSAKLAGVCLGYYDSAEMAALAYDKAARRKYRSFAFLNFPDTKDYSGLVAKPRRNVGERTSNIVGVSYSRNRRAKASWRAVYRKQHLGWFYTEQQAIDALETFKNEDQVRNTGSITVACTRIRHRSTG